MPRSIGHHHLLNNHGNGRELGKLERQYSEYAESTTNVEEVWFAGCHCGLCIFILVQREQSLLIIEYCVYTDIGGGSVPNGTRNSLARIPLRWMIRQCFIAKTGIMFHKSTFPKVGLDPDTLYPEVLPRSPIILQDRDKHTIPVPKPLVVSDDRTAVVYSDGGRFVNEAEEDLADALSPIYDQLSLAKYWWFLEWIPQTIKYQDGTTDLMVSELKYVTIYLFFLFSPSLLIGYSSLE